MEHPEESAVQEFTVDIDVRFRDLDAMGHVNNAVYFTYFEEGRKYFFYHLMQSQSAADFPFILARAECDYRRPIQLADPLSLRMHVSEMGGKSFILTYRLVHREDPSIVFATGRTVQVSYDYANQRTMTTSPEIRAKLTPYTAADAAR